jgi:hypothetical protein
MAIEIPNVLLAYGKVNADGTKASGAGFSSAKSAAGVYVITLDEEAADAQSSMLASLEGVALGNEIVNGFTTAKTRTVRTGTGGVAGDLAFNFSVYRAPG